MPTESADHFHIPGQIPNQVPGQVSALALYEMLRRFFKRRHYSSAKILH
jgi:hypothetical protein